MELVVFPIIPAPVPKASKAGTLTWMKFPFSEEKGFKGPLSTPAEPRGRQVVSDAQLSGWRIWRIVVRRC